MQSRSIMLSSLMLLAIACGSASKDDKSSTAAPGTSPDNPSGAPDTPNALDSNDAGTTPDPSSDSGSTKAPTNRAECITACEQKYPKPAQQNKLLDTSCMLGACEPVCNNIGTSGKNFPPDVDPDAGVVCDTAKANSYPISTPAVACSTCLANTASCCTLWIAIFGSNDGQALNVCANTCFNTFAK